MHAWFSNLSSNERMIKKDEKKFKFEFLIGWLIRLYNERCWVLPLVFLSIWAWKSKVSKPFWRFCTKIKLLYTVETIEMILTDLGLRLSTKKVLLEDESKASGKVILAVFDNCLVNFKTSYEGIRDNGDGSRAYLFINWLIAFIDKSDVPDAYDPAAINGLWTEPTSVSVLNWLLDTQAINNHINNSCIAMWNKINVNVLDILNHPPVTPATKSWFIYQAHVPTDNGTAAGYSGQEVA
mmetsp:Transcript_37563/g.48586  ORF Transcript_37563/g.48586 Transcript_37563/m.48586 type:complete len:238 (-) Transcript_37563:995-1708(-)